MTYNANDGRKEGKGVRFQVYPVALGLSAAGNLVVRAFQDNGSSLRGTPKWKLFRLDRINRWQPNKNLVFDSIPFEGYNEVGDDGMVEVYVHANFDNVDKKAKQKKATTAKKTVKKQPVVKNTVQNDTASNIISKKETEIGELKYANDFGEGNTRTTNGVVTKGEPEAKSETAPRDYTNIENNGVVTKAEPNVGKNVAPTLNYVDDKEEEVNDNNEEKETEENGEYEY